YGRDRPLPPDAARCPTGRDHDRPAPTGRLTAHEPRRFLAGPSDRQHDVRGSAERPGYPSPRQPADGGMMGRQTKTGDPKAARWRESRCRRSGRFYRLTTLAVPAAEHADAAHADERERAGFGDGIVG